PRLRHQLRAAGGARDPGPARLGDAGAAEGGARLRDRGDLHPGRGDHPARRHFPADAGDPDVPALRSGDRRRARAGEARGRGRRQRRRLMRPAGFARRCAAWSLDAALVALPVLALAWRHLRLAGTAVAEAWEVLATAAAQAMATTLAAAADTGGA